MSKEELFYRSANQGLFKIGFIVVTESIQEQLKAEVINMLLCRHSIGDWGSLSQDDKLANDLAVEDGGQILSSYHVDNINVLVMTESEHHKTTLFLPGEL